MLVAFWHLSYAGSGIGLIRLKVLLQPKFQNAARHSVTQVPVSYACQDSVVCMYNMLYEVRIPNMYRFSDDCTPIDALPNDDVHVH